MNECDFNAYTIGFIGFGLIGGSIAKALKEKYPNIQIVVSSRSLAPLEAAKNDGIVDIVCTQPDEHFCSCDYIFLCTPVVTITQYMKTLKPLLKPSCILTDVGSVKSIIQDAAAENDLLTNFIGAHPMAGSEKTGYSNSSKDLLCNARYVLTPNEHTSADALTNYIELVKAMGANPIVMDAAVHDKAVAGVSHLPHLISAALAKIIINSDDDARHMKQLAAGGFRDTTRIAASSPEMWSQICVSNSNAIQEMLTAYIDQLTEIQQMLQKSNASENDTEAVSNYIAQLFQEAGDYRRQF